MYSAACTSRNFRSPSYRIQVSLSGFVPQDTGFPVLEGRASETRPPGNCGRLCRGTQVSQGRPLLWGTTIIERGRVNYSSINGRGMKYLLAHSGRGETSRLTNSSNISMCLNAVNLMCHERLAFGSTHPPRLSGVRATEYKFPFRGSCLRTQVSLSWRDEL